MKFNHQKHLDKLYENDYDWQQYKLQYLENKAVFTERKREEKLIILEEEYAKNEVLYRETQQKLLNQAVQTLSQTKQAQYENTLRIRDVKKGMLEAKRIYDAQIEREKTRLARHEAGQNSLKEFNEALSSFIEKGAPKKEIILPKTPKKEGKPKTKPKTATPLVPKIIEVSKDEPEEEFPCPQCNKIYGSEAVLKRHITMKHKEGS